MRYKLKDICIAITDGSHFSPKATSDGFPMLSVKDMREFGFDYSNCKHISKDDYEKLKASGCVPQNGDVLVAKDGSYLKEIFTCIEDRNEAILSSIAIFRPNTQIILPQYLCYLLKSPSVFNYIKNNCVSGSALPRIVLKTFKEVELDVPSLSEQRKIVSVLSPIDNLIKMNAKINENLHQLMTTYYAEIFKDCDYSATISDYSERVFSGGTPTTSNDNYWNGSFKWLSSGETSQRFIVDTEKTITQEGIDNSSTRLASKYNTVIASAGQGHTRGQTSMLLTDSYVNQSIIVIDSEKVYMPFIYWNICGRYEELRVISNSNSIRGSLTTKMISSLSAPKADIELISKFSELSWSAIHEIEKNCNEISRLTALRDTLLPKLINGEIDVSAVKI